MACRLCGIGDVMRKQNEICGGFERGYSSQTADGRLLRHDREWVRHTPYKLERQKITKK